MPHEGIGKEIGTECTHCKGTGKSSKAICKHCDGEKIGKFYNNYIRTVKNSKTRRGTIRCLRQFAGYLKVKGYKINNFADLETFYEGNLKLLKETIITYISYLENDVKNLKRQTIQLMLSKIKGLYEMNEVILPWKVIIKTLGERTGKYKNRGYDAEEIKQLVDNSNLCYKAVLTLLASSGIRVGGINDNQGNFLKVGDIEEATKSFTEKELNSFTEEVPGYSGNVGKITVYRGSEWEYDTFCTPEAYKAINTYIEYRKAAGETITYESPLFVTEFNPNPITYNSGAKGKRVPADVLEKNRTDKIKHPKPLRAWSIQHYVEKRCLDLKIANRKVTYKTEFNGRKVYAEVPIIHGLRKFTGYTMDAAGVNDTVNELLMGHKLPGMREQYRRWPQWMKLVEYWKAVPDLTIDKTNVLTVQVKQKEREKKEVEIVAAERRGQLHEDYRAEIKSKNADYANLMEKHKQVLDMLNKIMGTGKVVPYPTPALPEEDPIVKENRELKQRLAALENKG